MQEEYCTLDPITRKLTLTEPQRIAGVESDEYAKGLKFKFPKTVDDIDLTQMQLRINFMNSRQEKGQHIVTDMKPMEGEEGYITFTWPFSRLVTHYRGYTKLVVCAVKTDESGTITAEWNTALAQMRVLEGLEVDGPEISPEEKDIIAQLISICQNSADKAAQSAQQAKEEANKIMNFGPEIGPNGNWYINGADTGKPSQGETPEIGENGNWFIGETDTGLPSRGITPNFKAGNTATLPAGSEATASITGTPENPILNLGIPQGDNGKTPNIQIGTVEALPAGSEATANITGEPENLKLNLGIPRGQDGESWEGGVTQYKLLNAVTLNEPVNSINLTQTDDDVLYTDLKLKEVFLNFKTALVNTTNYNYGIVNINGKSIEAGQNFALTTAFKYFAANLALTQEGKGIATFRDCSNTPRSSSAITYGLSINIKDGVVSFDDNIIKSVSVGAVSSEGKLNTGTFLYVYGR